MENKKIANTPAKWWPRIISGAIILIVLVGCFFLRELNNYVFDLLIGALMIFCAYEVENLLHKMDRPTWTTPVGLYPILCFLLIAICANSALNFYYFVLFCLAILVVMFVILFATPMIFSKWGNKLRVGDGFQGSLAYYSFSKAMNTIFVCLWPTFLFSFAFIINHFGQMSISETAAAFQSRGVDFGLMGLVLLFVTSMCADTFAMLTGRLIKGPKISMEKLGPGKTWTGLIGGIIGAIIGSIVVFAIFNAFAPYNMLFNSSGIDVNIWTFFIGGIFCGIFNMAGDLFSSYFKRRAVVKDFSQLIPGHGGVMDRCNGLLVNAVFVFIFFVILFV